MIDIGANLTHESFCGRVSETIAEAMGDGVEHIIVTGTDTDCSIRARQLARQHSQLSFTAGIHPHNAVAAKAIDARALDELWSDQRCVAVGELGLDYNRMYRDSQVQRECFIAQLELSQARQLPLFLHLRDAENDFIELVASHACSRRKVVHCYTGAAPSLKKLLDMDSMIGITGWICDERRNHDLLDSLNYLPIDRIMIESDAPWLLPRTVDNYRKIRHNHPRYLSHVLARLAQAKGLDQDRLARVLRANTLEFFNLELG